MKSKVYKTISVLLLVAVGMIIMAAHHEKEADELASLKAAFNLNWESWESADMETHFSTIYPESSGIFNDGNLSDMKNIDYDQVRQWVKSIYQTVDIQRDTPNFNIRGNVAIVTYTDTVTDTHTHIHTHTVPYLY